MQGPIGIAWLTQAGTVAKRTTMNPNRVAFGPTNLVLESVDPDALPPEGTTLTAFQ